MISVKCKDFEELDWIERIVGKKPHTMSHLNSRMMIQNIQKNVENALKNCMFESFDNITCKKIENHLEKILYSYKNKQTIYDYKIDTTRLAMDKEMDINIKPTKTIEHINLNFKIQEEGGKI